MEVKGVVSTFMATVDVIRQAIDLGAVAKGAACTIIRQVAQEYEIKTGYVSVGGNLIVLGKDPQGEDFRFAIRDPQGEASEYIATLSLTGSTMATTGAYERWFEQDGKRYHHIIDPAHRLSGRIGFAECLGHLGGRDAGRLYVHGAVYRRKTGSSATDAGGRLPAGHR